VAAARGTGSEDDTLDLYRRIAHVYEQRLEAPDRAHDIHLRILRLRADALPSLEVIITSHRRREECGHTRPWTISRPGSFVLGYGARARDNGRGLPPGLPEPTVRPPRGWPMPRYTRLFAVVALAGPAAGAQAVPVPALTLTGHTAEVYTVAFAPDGRTLASASNREVKGWDAATGTPRFTYKIKGSNVYGLAYSPDGRRIAVSVSRQVFILDAANGTEVRTFPAAPQHIFRLTYSPDGRFLTAATGTNTNGTPGEVCVWEADAGKNARRLQGHAEAIMNVAYSADGRRLASAGGSTSGKAAGEIKVWDADTGREVRALCGHTDNVYGVTFSPDGRLVASGSGVKGGSDPGATKLWEVATGQPVLTLAGHKGPVFGVVLGGGGRWLATAGGDGAIKVWDAASGTELASLARHTGAAYGIALSPDGRRLASAGADQTVNVWDVAACVPPPASPPTGRDPKALWSDLAGTDAARANRAMWEMASCPELSVPFLRDRLRPEPGLSAEQRQQASVWLRTLDDGRYQRREKATRELARLGEAVRPLLRDALAGKLAAEGRQRVARLLEALADPPLSGDRLAALRGLAALEHAGTRDARAVLRTVATGLPEARLTTDARGALDRLARRPAGP
jgi:WD40 repeat protein